MESEQDKIRITPEDLAKPPPGKPVGAAGRPAMPPPPEADASPAERQKAQMQYPPAAADAEAVPTLRRFSLISSAALYLALAGAAGALIAWALTEALLPPVDIDSPHLIMIHSAVWAALVGCLAGGAIGCAEGLAAKNPAQAIRSGCFGYFTGMFGCAFGALIGQGFFFLVVADGIPHLALGIVARATAWGIAGLCMGAAQGLALWSGRKTVNGLLGGLLGGALGGLLFDPIEMLLGDIGGGLVSRLVGLLVLGIGVGCMIGLVEELLKNAWLRVVQGNLAGKQFVIYKNPTLIGSSPKCHITLFKDPNVEPQHAAIHIAGGHCEIEDLRSPQGTYVNEQAATRQTLRNGDQIRIGKTVFHYSEKR